MPLNLAWLGAIPWKKILKKILPYLAVVAVVVGVGWYIYSHGYKNGETSVQVKWDKEKLANQQALIKLRQQAATKEQNHLAESQRITDELANSNEKYAATVARLDVEYAQRLSNSAKREAYYKHLSTAGATEQANLASHAAELDRSLEEGRRLVQELSATVRQRDAQIRALAGQLLTDRVLTGEKDGTSSVSTE